MVLAGGRSFDICFRHAINPENAEVPDTHADRLSAAAGSGRSAAVALKATELELVLQKPLEAPQLNVYAAGTLLLFIGGVLAKSP